MKGFQWLSVLGAVPVLGTGRIFQTSSSAPRGPQSSPRSAFLTYWLVPYCLPSIFPGWTTARGIGDLSNLSPTILRKDSRFPKTPWRPLCCEPSAPGRAQMLDVLAAEETDRTQAEGGRSCWPVGCGRVRGRAGENRPQKGSPVRRGL